MPCDSVRQQNQTLEERVSEIDAALKRLEGYLKTGTTKIAIAPNGAVAFAGWQDRAGITDVCAYRTLAANNSWELRQAVARAEATQGRKVNAQAVAAGHHSHDDGKTWSKH